MPKKGTSKKATPPKTAVTRYRVQRMHYNSDLGRQLRPGQVLELNDSKAVANAVRLNFLTKTEENVTTLPVNAATSEEEGDATDEELEDE